MNDRRQSYTDELIAALREPLPGVSDVEDEAATLRIANEEIKRYREKRRSASKMR
jgi:hypothetical protein